MEPAELDDRELGYIVGRAGGSLLGPPCLHLGSSWLHLGPSWLHLGPYWFHLGSSWLHLGSSWLILAPSWLILAPQNTPPKLLRKKVKTSPSGNCRSGRFYDEKTITFWWRHFGLGCSSSCRRECWRGSSI